MYSSGPVSYRRLTLSACLLSLFLISWLYLPATRLTRQQLSTALASHKNPFASSSSAATTTAQQDYEHTKARVELVVSSVKAENTSWITDNFPHYPAHIYVADDPHAPLTVKHNIGHESTVYLTYGLNLPSRRRSSPAMETLEIPRTKILICRYIIDNYHKLPDVVIFIHGRRYQWHNEDPLYGKS